MFTGEYEHNLDGKNRLNIPAKFREIVEKTEETRTLHITLGLDKCLFLFTHSQWGEVAGSLKSMPFTGSAARRFKRIFYANAREVELDDQGRILVPESLKNEAGITRCVTITGVDDRMEIWDRDLWNSMKSEAQGEYEKLAERLFDREEGADGR